MAQRIISGIYGRRVLSCPKEEFLRPLTGASQKSLFDILSFRVRESSFCDLFAGCGSVGIEALSRGSRFCTFVEKNPRVCEFLQKNLETLKISPDKYALYKEDVFSFLEKPHQKFDIVFAGPPYSLKMPLDLIEKIFKILEKDGVFILQRHFKMKEIFPVPPKRVKKFGSMLLEFYENCK